MIWNTVVLVVKIVYQTYYMPVIVLAISTLITPKSPLKDLLMLSLVFYKETEAQRGQVVIKVTQQGNHGTSTSDMGNQTMSKI